MKELMKKLVAALEDKTSHEILAVNSESRRELDPILPIKTEKLVGALTHRKMSVPPPETDMRVQINIA